VGAALPDLPHRRARDARSGELGATGVVVPDAEDLDVALPHVRPQVLDVREVVLPAAGRQGQLLAAGRADARGVAGMAEVGGAVDHGDPVAPCAAQGERGAELDRAVTAQHHGELPGPHVSLDAVGELAGVRGDGLRVEHPVALFPAPAVVAGRHHHAADGGASPRYGGRPSESDRRDGISAGRDVTLRAAGTRARVRAGDDLWWATARRRRGRPRMMALATIGFILGVTAFCVGLLLFMVGGPNYRRD
jgi:hypothetical protein